MAYGHSISRQGVAGVDEAQLRKQIARESHRRWILNQRLTVLERTNADLKASITKLVALDPAGAVVVQPRLTIRSSSDGAEFDWDVIVGSCMALVQSNAQMRVMVATILADKQIIDYRLQHVSSEDVLEVESYVNRIVEEKKQRRGATNPDSVFQQMLGLSPQQPPCPGRTAPRSKARILAVLNERFARMGG